MARLEAVIVGGAPARARRGGARRQRRAAWSSPTPCSATCRRRADAGRSARCSTDWPHAEGRLAESDYPAAFRYLAARNRKRALTVLFTDVIDRTASEALVAHAATLRPRHLPLAVTLRDPALEALAAARPGQRRRRPSSGRRRRSCSARARRRWRRCGAAASWCWTCRRRGAGEAVVARYHQLKRRGTALSGRESGHSGSGPTVIEAHDIGESFTAVRQGHGPGRGSARRPSASPSSSSSPGR